MSEVIIDMKELLTYIVANLVSDPEAISIEESVQGDEVTYSLRVAPEDMGLCHRPSWPNRQGNPHAHESGW